MKDDRLLKFKQTYDSAIKYFAISDVGKYAIKQYAKNTYRWEFISDDSAIHNHAGGTTSSLSQAYQAANAHFEKLMKSQNEKI